MDWKECFAEGIIKEVKPDLHMIESLIKSGKNRLESEKRLEIDPITAASKISLAYDSLREFLEAFAMKKGYRIYNHECYKAFLKEIMKESSMGDEFDRLRKIRNSVNYYGKDISISEAANVLSRIRKMATHVIDMLER